MARQRSPAPVSGRAVTFDLWYTLLGLEPAEEEAYIDSVHSAACDLLVSWPADERGRPAPSRERARSEFRREFLRASALSAEGRSWGPTAQIRSVARRLGRAPAPETYLHRLAEIVSKLPLRPAVGAAETLKTLRGAGYRIGVVSNTVGEPGAALEQVCGRLGLARWIEAWAWSDQHPWTKPAPQLFRWCLNRLGVTAAAAVHVGDAWSDIAGGRAAGYRATVQFLGLANYSPEYKRTFVPALPPTTTPTRTCRRFAELGRIVPALFEGPAPDLP